MHNPQLGFEVPEFQRKGRQGTELSTYSLNLEGGRECKEPNRAQSHLLYRKERQENEPRTESLTLEGGKARNRTVHSH